MGFQKLIIIFIFSFCFNEVFSKDNLDKKIPSPEPYKNSKFTNPRYNFDGRQYMFWSLDTESRKQHKEAIYFMLSNAVDGEVVSWFNDNNKDHGQMRVLESYQISSGYCRIYQSVIYIGNEFKSKTFEACKGLSFGDGSSLYNWIFNE
jgi:hypothetical protein